MLKSWPTGQSTIALSSSEAELFALTNVAAQMLGLISMAADFGMATRAKIHTDSTAALGMVLWSGLGRK